MPDDLAVSKFSDMTTIANFQDYTPGEMKLSEVKYCFDLKTGFAIFKVCNL